jgi:drug/metabolite transporter (DMT)-like permease
VAVLIAAIGFLLPWYLLLFRPLKRNRRTLAAIAGLLVCMQLVNVFWMVEPPFERDGPVVDWLDVFAVVGFGGLWLAVFVWQLAARPLLPAHDPRLQPALEAAHEPA